MPEWVRSGYDEYAKRMPAELKPQLAEIPLGRRRKGEAATRALAEVMWTKVEGQRWESGIRFLIILNEADDHSIHQFLETVKEGD